MKGQAALLLLVLLALSAEFGAARVQQDSAAKDLLDELKSNESRNKEATSTTRRTTTSSRSTDSELSSILSIRGKDMLESTRSGDDDDSNNNKIQEEVAKLIKAQAQKKSRPAPIRVRVSNSSSMAAAHGSYNTTDNNALKALLEAEDMVYNEDMDDAYDEDEDDDDDYDNDDDDDDDDEDDNANTANDDDDDDDADDDDDDINEDEEVMAGCPDYCRCVGQFVAAVTARCTKLQDDQGFGSGIAHLKIENAGDIRLGPHALRKLGLRQLESISIVDTKIVELDRTAFDGLKELFVVNLTHNGLTTIHPDTFQNNSQLSLLTISGNPLKLMNSRRSANIDYLLDAPSVTELDFSNNQISRLPRRAFAKMPNLAYISLKHNRLNNIESNLFAPLDSLVELDISHNLLSDLPMDLFKGKGLQTLRMAGNSLTSLSTIRVPKLTILDVSMNRLKSITKDDLDGVPNLDELYLSANTLKRIHPHAFSDLDQLTYLDLRNNNLMNLSEHHFRANSRLQVLLLSDNPDLVSLPVFRTNAQEFERFSIYRFECENCGLSFIEVGTFDAMPAMTKLNLARNKLTGFPKDLMRSLSSLRDVDLSMNRLERLEDDMFEGATSLTKLSLALNSFVSGIRVTPFLKTPNLLRLDLSFCGMQKIWSQLNIPVKSLRYLVLHKNRLTRLTIEELRVVPNLSGLDVSRNPLQCDEELSAAVQWLTDHNVNPTELLRDGSGQILQEYDNQEPTPTLDSDKGWTDLAKKLCDSWEVGPPARPVPKKVTRKPTLKVTEEPAGPIIKFDFDDEIEITNKLDYGQGHTTGNDDLSSAWTRQDQEYEELAVERDMQEEYNYAYHLWPFMIGALATVTVFLVTAHLIVCLAKRRGRGPVIRTPMILRPGIIDSKNCGLVYKPLQEEIATPHMPKRGSFYSSSTFHYDKIVPESV